MGSKHVSWMVVFGQVTNFLAALLKAVQELGGSEVDLNAVAADPRRMGSIAAIVMNQLSPQAVTMPVSVTTFTALVEYVMPSFQELKQRFDWVNSNFATAKFELIDSCKEAGTAVRELEFVYVHLDRKASDAEVQAEHERLRVRPATFPELLAFAAKYPDEQRKFLIVARGSVAVLNGRRRVAYLDGGGRERGLDHRWTGGVWGRFCRFLAVPLVPMAA